MRYLHLVAAIVPKEDRVEEAGYSVYLAGRFAG
jgi:hypothetical protein